MNARAAPPAPPSAPGAALLAALAAALTLSGGAAAQHPGIRIDGDVRPLHVQLARADAAAIATVEAVELGRIRVTDARPVLGAPPERFEIKRAPSKPPRLRPGSRVLLLLAGARSPYLLVSTAEEIVAVEDAGAESAWLRALRRAEAERATPSRLEALYAAWLGGPEEALWEAASLGLRDARAPFRPLAGERLAGLIELATDPVRPVAQRRAAASAAASQREGAEALLARLPLSEGAADPALLSDALRRAALLRSDRVGPTLLRCLRHPDPEVRRVALRFGALLDAEPDARAEIERVAAEDPVAELREAAARLLRSGRAERRPAGRAAGEASRR